MSIIAETREAIEKVVVAHGGRRYGTGPSRNYYVPIPGTDGRVLTVETHVRGSVTTDLAMERWKCLDAPHDLADPWLTENIWPAVQRWVRRSGAHSAFLPNGGSFSGTTVLTAEAADVLAAWLPMEIRWQQIMTEADS